MLFHPFSSDMFMKLKSYGRKTPKIKVFEKKVVKVVLAECRLENVKSVHDFMINM